MSGFFAWRINVAAWARSSLSQRVRGMIQTRLRKNSSGKSKASVCTSCGRLRVTAPVSAGEDIARQQQNRDAIDGCGSRAGEHVGGAGTDGSGASKGAKAETGFGESG